MCLGAVVEEVRGLDPEALTDGELAELLVALTDLREAAEATQLRTMGVFEGRQVHKADGAYTAASWLRERSHLSTTESNSLARHARMIRTRPMLAHALDTLGAGKVRTILRYTTGRTMDAFAEAEAEILQQAAQFSVDEMASIMRWWGRRVDQDGREPKSWDDCELSLNKTYEGDYALGGGLDGLTGAELEAALDSEAESIFRAGGMGDQRPLLAHRRAIALMALIRRALDPDIADTQVPPTVMVTVTLEELLKGTGRAHLVNTGEYIDAETARRIACEAGITRIITGPRGEVLDLGRSVRSAPLRYKKALAVRDGHCVFPGCRMAPNKCSAHHILWWDRDHGPTALWNLALLCHHHHHLVHEGRWTMTRAPDGTLEFRRPDGSLLII
jgi:hypothetical protein